MDRSPSHPAGHQQASFSNPMALTGALKAAQREAALSQHQTGHLRDELLARDAMLCEEERQLQQMDTHLHALQREVDLLNCRVDYLTNYDRLTGLNNRYDFDRAMNDLLNGESAPQSLAMMHLNLDGFQSINHTKGHDIGNLFLQEVANRMRSVVMDPNQLFYLGGDEFIVISIAVHSDARVQALCNALLLACHQTFDVGDVELNVSASIGVARYPQDWDSNSPLDKASQLKKKASIALQQAKRDGKNRSIFFKVSMDAKAEAVVASQAQLRQGIELEEFIPYFQPQYNVTGPIAEQIDDPSQFWTHSDIVGFEILARWRPTGTDNIVPPSHFFGMAEKMNLVRDIDVIVVKKLCELLQGHPSVLDHVEHISLNFSAETFSSEKHVYKAIDLMNTYQVPADKIVIELTEHTFFKSNEATIANMNLMRSLGFRFALDDFGTGYSALHCLNLLPLDFLKIDQAFVRPMESDDFYRVMISHIVSLARDLNLEIVAEGLESNAQLQYLHSLGVEVFQGYFFSKPLSTQQYLQLVHDW